MTTVAVTVTAKDQSGNPVSGAKVKAVLSAPDVNSGYIIPEKVEAITGLDGKAVLNLWPNELGATETFYTFIIKADQTAVKVKATIPNQSCNLEDVANLPPYDGKTEVQMSTDAAAGYAASASNSASFASVKANDATAQAELAEEHKNAAAQSAADALANKEATDDNLAAAVTAKGLAEDAQSAAESAAETATDKAAEATATLASVAKSADLAASGGASAIGAIDGASGTLWTTVAGFIAKIMSSAGASVIGFIQAGTGAVMRSLQDKARERVSVKDFGAKGDGVTDDTAAIQAAFNFVGINGMVYIPTGRYKTSSAISATCSFYGDGSGTVILPSGGHEAFTVRVGRADYRYAEYVGDYVIDFTQLGSVTSADVGMWLCKGATPAANSGCNNATFGNIFIQGGYRGIQMLSTDLGNLWNVKFQKITCFKFTERGIYIDTTGSNGSLNVDFDTVTCDGFNIASARGAVIRGISNVRFFGVAAVPVGQNGGCFNMLDCMNAEVRLQIEGVVTSSALSSGLVSFANCKNVELSLVSQTCTFNQGAGQLAHYIYADSNVTTLTIRAFTAAADVYTSGTTYKVNLQNGAASNTKLCILDQNIVRSDVYAASANLNATRWPDTNYALEKTSTTRRLQALDVAVPISTATNLVSVADYASRSYQVAGLYIIQGSWTGNNTIGFTDLVLVTGVGQTTAQTAVVVSGNSINSGHARTYDISGGYLRVSIAPPSGSYVVSATGFDQSGAAN